MRARSVLFSVAARCSVLFSVRMPQLGHDRTMPRSLSRSFDRSHTRALLAVCTAIYLAFVGWVTLGPQPLNETNSGWLTSLLAALAGSPATAWITYSLVEFLANIAMFVPIGCLFLLVQEGTRRRWWLALLLGIALTCGIEFTQQFLPTRVPDVRDIVANSLGAALGIGVGLAILGIRSPRQQPR